MGDQVLTFTLVFTEDTRSDSLGRRQLTLFWTYPGGRRRAQVFFTNPENLMEQLREGGHRVIVEEHEAA